ncbi:MAG TPA: AsmA family protein, partial [Terriglobales bacterium]
MRKLAIGIGIFIVLIVGGFLVFAATLNVNKYHQTIQSELEKALGRRVSLGDMQLGLFPPRFRVQELAVGDDPQFSADAPFIRAQEVDVSIKLWPLLHKQVEISSLDLTRPSVNFIKNSAGVWNVASLGHPSESSLPADTPNNPASKTSISQQTPTSSTPTSSAQQQFSLGELIIRDGQISVLDQQKSKTPSL